MKDEKVYLGDGAYVNFDGWHVVLTAENGIYATDTVCLDPDVLASFLEYTERLRKFLTDKRKKDDEIRRSTTTDAPREESQACQDEG